MTAEYVSTYACEASAPGRARRWSQNRLLATLPDAVAHGVSADASIVVSELMSNSVRAGCGTARLTLSVGPDTIRIAVGDDAAGSPQARTAGPDEEHGRGLRIVESLSRRWGVERTGDGKQVWAELTY